MAILQLEVADDLLEILRLQGEPMERVARELMVLELYRRGVISGGKAGELLGMNRFDFIRHASNLGIPYIDFTEEEWAAELASVNDMVRTLRSSPTQVH